MNALLRVVVVGVVCTLFFANTFATEVKKEKVQLKIAVPAYLETPTKESTYHYDYPTQLKYFREDKFSNYALGFCSIDGLIRDRFRVFLPTKIFGTVPTDYRFELITDGISNLQKVGSPYSSSVYGGLLVQDFSYTFKCELKVFKKDQLVKSFLIDDGNKTYNTVFYQNFEITQKMGVQSVGFSDEQSLNSSLVSSTPLFSKFCYLTEYSQYLASYNAASSIILDLYGSYNLKTSLLVGFVDEKDASNFVEFNSKSTELFNVLTLIKSYDDIKSQLAFYKSNTDYYSQFYTNSATDKDLKLITLRNLAICQILSGNTIDAFKTIETHDRMASGLANSLFEIFNIESSRNYMSTYQEGTLVLGSNLNDLKEQKRIALEEEEKARLAEESLKKALEEERLLKEDSLRLIWRNYSNVTADVTYTNGSTWNNQFSIPFYKKDSEGQLLKHCGKRLYVGPDGIQNIDRIFCISIKNQDNTVTIFYPVEIVNSFALIGSEVKLSEYRAIQSGIKIFVDRTDPIDETFMLVPTQNNPKSKGYKLRDILETKKFPEWIKLNEKIASAIKSGEIKDNMAGALKLADLLAEQNLPNIDLKFKIKLA